MSEKMTCPVCSSHTSTVLSRVSEGQPCPYCDTPADVIMQVAVLREKRADDHLKAEVERLLIENGKLTAERDRLARKVEKIKQAMDGDFDGF